MSLMMTEWLHNGIDQWTDETTPENQGTSQGGATPETRSSDDDQNTDEGYDQTNGENEPQRSPEERAANLEDNERPRKRARTRRQRYVEHTKSDDDDWKQDKEDRQQNTTKT